MHNNILVSNTSEIKNSGRFDSLIEMLRLPPTEEEQRLLETGVEEDLEDEWDEAEDALTPELAAELEAIEAEIEEELIHPDTTPNNKNDEERWEQLDALVMSRARGVGELLGFAQNTMRPAWVRARAIREVMRLENHFDNALYAGAFHIGTQSAQDRPEPVDLEGVLLEKDRNDQIHAEYLARRTSEGFSLAVDLEDNIKEALGDNVTLHMALFDRESGKAFKQADVQMKRASETQYHADVFDMERLTQADLERAEALFWIESKPPEEDEDPSESGNSEPSKQV